MKIYIVRVWNSYVTDGDYHDTYWLSYESANKRVQELNDQANEDGRKELSFDIFIVAAGA